MDTAFISAFSALGGSIIGGLTTGVTSWLGYQSQTKASHRLRSVTQRGDLYRDFVVAASDAYGNAVINSEPQIHEIVVLYGLIGRMRILSTARVVACAEKTLNLIIDEYFSAMKSMRQLRELMANGETIDPLREFSEITRDELRTI